jgi:isochorismate hydrolase
LIGSPLSKDDILDIKVPSEGDPVLYVVYDTFDKQYRSQVGIIMREVGDDHVIISGVKWEREQVLYVLTSEGFMKQKRITNRLAL